MGLFTPYTEIYSTMKQEDFFRAKNLLADNNVLFKDTSISNQQRVSRNNMRGSNITLSRTGSPKTTYCLSVKKDEAGKARQLLRAAGL